MHCGMGPTASCRVLRACGVFGGWPAGQIKQKPSCGYRRSCPKAVSSWVRVPQQLLVHGMLVIQVCTSPCGVCNSTSMGAKKHHLQPIATCRCHCAARLPNCRCNRCCCCRHRRRCRRPDREHRRMVRAVLHVLWCRPVGRVGTVATGDLIQKAGAGSGAQAARSGLAAAAAAAAAVASVVTAVTVIA